MGIVVRQVVVLFQILAAEINFGYRFQTAQCVQFNGQDLRNVRQLAEMVRASVGSAVFLPPRGSMPTPPSVLKLCVYAERMGIIASRRALNL